MTAPPLANERLLTIATGYERMGVQSFITSGSHGSA